MKFINGINVRTLKGKVIKGVQLNFQSYRHNQLALAEYILMERRLYILS
jgi:hypothetical protein